MKGLIPILFIGGSSIVAIMLAKGLKTKEAGDKLQFRFKDIKNLKISNLALNFDIGYEAINPTSSDLNIESMILKAGFKNGPSIANINQTTVVKVPKMNSVTGSIRVSTNNLIYLGVNLISKLSSLLTSANNSISETLLIEGTVKANGFTSPYKQELPFNLKS